MKGIVFIHRGRNPKSDFLGSLITKKTFIFDYRGKNTFVMLCKAFFALWRLPQAEFYLVEGGLDLWPAFFKKIFNPKIKIIMMAPEPAFNWRARSRLKNALLKKIFNFVDYFLPISRLVANDLQFYVNKPFSIVHHFSTLDYNELLKIQPDYSKKNILFMINRPAETGWTKGLDIVLKIFELLYLEDRTWQLYFIGAGTERLDIENLISKNNIHLEGSQNPKKYFLFCPFILSPARYDAFPLAIVEACVAGVIPFVSPTTGTAGDFIEEVNKNLVIDYNNAKLYAERIRLLAGQSEAEKKALAQQLRERTREYTKENAIQELQNAIVKMREVFGIPSSAIKDILNI